MKRAHDYKSRFRILKGGKIALVISAMIGSASLLSAAPSGGIVTTGSATISKIANSTTITQSTNKASINWQSFSVAPTETVNFIQPSASSITLNRVVGVTNSLIEGTMNANGQVFLINPNGIIFSKGSSVNVGGLVVTTLNISDKDFQSGNYTFSGTSTNSILNMGAIHINSGGYGVLAGKTVSNEGLISATLGNVQLAGASKVTLNLNGNSLVKLTIDKGVLNSLVENKGIIKADGGQVYLTTQALSTVLDGMVNNTGVIEANSIDTQNGQIVLFAHGGTTSVDGTLSAKDGAIETSGTDLSIAGTVDIKAKTWLLDPTDITIQSSGGTDLAGSSINAGTIATALNGGTNVTLQADNNINVNQTIDWTQSLLTLNAGNDIFINATLNATNTAGLSLLYAQITPTGTYNIHDPINLATTGSFSTKYKSTGSLIHYTIIDALGAQGSTTGTDLQGMRGNLSGKYVLGSNIDASATSSWSSGAGFVPIGNSSTRFTGIFDGLGHIINGLTIDRPSSSIQGLFGFTGIGSRIQNIGLVGGSVHGLDYIGGLVGYSYRSSIKNSYAMLNVIGREKVGGLVGLSSSTSITNSFATGNVSGTTSVGGLGGYVQDNVLNNTYATGKVSGTTYVGGLVGFANSSSNKIINSYAIGSVSGTTTVGGLVGYNIGTVSNSHWDIDTTGRSNGIGYGSSTGTTGVHSTTTTPDAFTQAAYTGFDFTNDWFMIDGQTRPFLRSEYSTTITNDHQLQLMAMDLGASYTLANDITYSGDMWSSRGFNPIGNQSSQFTGGFDGLGHTISNLFIDRGTTNFIGLFGFINSNLTIQNIGLKNVDITGQNYTGGLVGWNTLTINNSFTTGKVSGTSSVGGLVGSSENTIKNSYSTSNVEGNANNTGGLVGYNSRKIENSYATGNVSGRDYVGGLVGENGSASSEIINSYATGSVTTTNDYAGGLVGHSYGSITDSYATGHITSGRYYIGGLVAGNTNGVINNSYWDIDTTGTSVGFGSNSGTITNLIGVHSSTSTINAFTQSSYTGFDFTNNWILYEGHTRPLLRVFMTPLTVTAKDATKTYDGNVYSNPNGVTYSTTPNANLFGTPSYGTDKNVGTYTITPSGLYSNQQGYIISYGSGTLSITPAPLSVTLNNSLDKVALQPNPSLSGAYSINGCVQGDCSLEWGSAITNTTPMGTYAYTTPNMFTLNYGSDLASNYTTSWDYGSGLFLSIKEPTGFQGVVTPVKNGTAFYNQGVPTLTSGMTNMHHNLATHLFSNLPIRVIGEGIHLPAGLSHELYTINLQKGN
ncbi:MAG: GLUG motif-containing protein [Sulfurospirillaceae bacterium]|nr:GLUG motif-containing protein [Sulfurospirillaceae bacterium]